MWEKSQELNGLGGRLREIRKQVEERTRKRQEED